MSSNPWLRCNKLSKNHGYSSEIVSVESKQFIPLAEGGTKQIVYQGRSVAVEIPLNRGHICSVLSKGILSGLRAKENDRNYAFGRLVSSRVVSIVLLRRRDRKNIRCWCSISSDDWLTLLWPIKTCVISYFQTTPFKWPGLSGRHFFCVLLRFASGFMTVTTVVNFFFRCENVLWEAANFFALQYQKLTNQITSSIVDLQMEAKRSG